MSRAIADPRSLASIALRHLRYFIVVSEELHFGRAADRLYLSQPPLSHAIRKLETAVGVPLLDRSRRGVALTQAGALFAETARGIVALLNTGVEETRRAGGAEVTVRIGCMPALPAQVLLDVVHALHRREPDIAIQIEHHHSLELLRRLRNGKLDVAVMLEPDDDAGLVTEYLRAGEQLAAYLPADHRLATRQAIGPDDVGGEHLVTGPSSTNPVVYRRMLDMFAEAGYRFRGVATAGGATARDLLLAVASGMGIAFAPRSLQEHTDVGRIVVRRPLERPLAMPPTFVAWPAEPPRGLEQVGTAVREAARELRAVWEPADTAGSATLESNRAAYRSA